MARKRKKWTKNNNNNNKKELDQNQESSPLLSLTTTAITTTSTATITSAYSLTPFASRLSLEDLKEDVLVSIAEGATSLLDLPGFEVEG